MREEFRIDNLSSEQFKVKKVIIFEAKDKEYLNMSFKPQTMYLNDLPLCDMVSVESND